MLKLVAILVTACLGFAEARSFEPSTSTLTTIVNAPILAEWWNKVLPLYLPPELRNYYQQLKLEIVPVLPGAGTCARLAWSGPLASAKNVAQVSLECAQRDVATADYLKLVLDSAFKPEVDQFNRYLPQLPYNPFFIEIHTLLMRIWSRQAAFYQLPTARKIIVQNNYFQQNLGNFAINVSEGANAEPLNPAQIEKNIFNFWLKATWHYMNDPLFYQKNRDLFLLLKDSIFEQRVYFKEIPYWLKITDVEFLKNRVLDLYEYCGQLDAVEVLIAEKGAGYGMAGHTFIRINDCDGIEDNDLVFSYAGLVNPEVNTAVGALLALFAQLPLTLQYSELSQIKAMYNLHENRAITAYALKINDSEKWAMLLWLVDRYIKLKNPVGREHYSIINKNCSTEARETIAKSLSKKLPADLTSRIPFLLNHYLEKQRLIDLKKVSDFFPSRTQIEKAAHKKIKDLLLVFSELVGQISEAEEMRPLWQAALVPLKNLASEQMVARQAALLYLNQLLQVLRQQPDSLPLKNEFLQVLYPKLLVQIIKDSDPSQQQNGGLLLRELLLRQAQQIPL